MVGYKKLRSLQVIQVNLSVLLEKTDINYLETQRPWSMLKILLYSRGYQFFQISPRFKNFKRFKIKLWVSYHPFNFTKIVKKDNASWNVLDNLISKYQCAKAVAKYQDIEGYSTQHFLLTMLEKWKKYVD